MNDDSAIEEWERRTCGECLRLRENKDEARVDYRWECEIAFTKPDGGACAVFHPKHFPIRCYDCQYFKRGRCVKGHERAIHTFAPCADARLLKDLMAQITEHYFAKELSGRSFPVTDYAPEP